MRSDDRVTPSWSSSTEYRVKLNASPQRVSYAPTLALPHMHRASGYNAEKSCLLRPGSITEAGT